MESKSSSTVSPEQQAKLAKLTERAIELGLREKVHELDERILGNASLRDLWG